MKIKDTKINGIDIAFGLKYGIGAANLRKAVEAKKAERDSAEKDVVVIPQGAVRQGKGTVEHSIVRYKGEQIGIIQTRTTDGNPHVDVLTVSPESGARRGRQIRWLIELAERGNWLEENKRLQERQARLRARKNFNQ